MAGWILGAVFGIFLRAMRNFCFLELRSFWFFGSSPLYIIRFFGTCCILVMIIEFPWAERWLNGKEYEFMIRNYENYIEDLHLQIFLEHPIQIYTSPSHGFMYYLQDQSLKELGFPRIKGLKKRFKWKKMNFVTSLPKQNPKVLYLVATGKLGTACYRMHIVSCDDHFPILCHMLRIQNHLKIGIGIPSRQHFKELQSEKKIEKENNSNNPSEFSNTSKKIHPLEIEALLYIVAPFRTLSDITPKNPN